jgi:8-oxo-dGTP pyrophosphatase MutT (NUDIX family)
MNEPVAPLKDLADTAEEFFGRARARLTLDVPAALTDLAAPTTRGDFDLDPSLWERAGVQATRPAAVLVPVVAHPEPTVLLTVRTPDLPSHPGQIAFPGGKIDPHDETPLAAAIREGEEEIGLDPRFVDPIGYLDLYLTFSGFRILPALVRVNPGFSLTVNPSEVVEAFEVPLPFLMEPANHAQKTREWRNIQRTYLEMPYGDRHIWGITAGILHNLYQRIYAG